MKKSFFHVKHGVIYEFRNLRYLITSSSIGLVHLILPPKFLINNKNNLNIGTKTHIPPVFNFNSCNVNFYNSNNSERMVFFRFVIC